MDEEKIKLICTKIRLKRIEMGYSQEYMAYQLSISQNVYSQNERNIKNVPFYRVLLLVNILGLDISELINA
ncbi:helix-turn-helix domain-containing protein [Pedobacter endophyticus]|uniref:Helix-turn-helix transcriptional regulator n=1 Tax=Pedobacter endophyticus TaxID=2789740 RepID=A0A7U3Q4P8_9SPHI|nr:helix-turn-helix transcriptional regulator [Pedobacter endophyticus]QPH38264.1 helix-turn-helix transcriptional regulator [Pedobacter endophyticus]